MQVALLKGLARAGLAEGQCTIQRDISAGLIPSLSITSHQPGQILHLQKFTNKSGNNIPKPIFTTMFLCSADGENNADGEPVESTRGKKRKHEDEDEN